VSAEAEKIRHPNRRGNVATWLPNILTYLRIVAVPLVVGLLIYGGETNRWIALAIFVAAAITDFFDGYLARIWQQQSSLGRMLDPIADKLLIASVLLAVTYTGQIYSFHIWAAVIILCREILVSGLREFLAELRVSVPVTQMAKWKTTIQMVAIAFLIVGPAGDKVMEHTSTIGLVFLWIAALATLYTGLDYFRAGVKHVMDEDE
jgi:cardiolipin synthase (CMP-forming)